MEPIKPQLLSATKITFPDNETVVNKSVPFTSGDSFVNAQFILACTNLPVGTRLSLSSPDSGPIPPINIAPAIVTASPGFSLGITCSVPASYSTNLNFIAQMPAGFLTSPHMSVTIQVFTTR